MASLLCPPGELRDINRTDTNVALSDAAKIRTEYYLHVSVYRFSEGSTGLAKQMPGDKPLSMNPWALFRV